mgnify:CR=1 FL=1
MAAVAERRDEVRLDLEGMTCAACAARIEKRLNGLAGVEATVNLATERATVKLVAGTPLSSIEAAIRHAGYEPRRLDHVDADAHQRHDHGHQSANRRYWRNVAVTHGRKRDNGPVN